MTDSIAPADPASSARARAQATRRAREAAALRANLGRRKQQARARTEAVEPAPPLPPAATDEEAPCR